MNKELPKASILPWPKIRELIIDLIRTGYKTHTIHGFTEIDISKALALIKEYKLKIKNGISFSSFLIYCIGQAAMKHPIIHAFRKGRKQIIIFDDVDINTIFEKDKPGGIKIPVSYIYRAANTKSLAKLNYEAQKALTDSLLEHKDVKRRARMLKLPSFFRKLLWKIIESNPYLVKDHRGTIGLTNVGAFYGNRPGWGIPITPLTTITIGSIYDKVYLTNGIPENRKTLCITISVNHDIIDGVPAVKFADLFAELVETAAGLDQNFIDESIRLFQGEKQISD